MIKRLKSFLSALAGVLVGIMIVRLFQNGEIDWDTVGALIAVNSLLLLSKLGLNLYKK